MTTSLLENESIHDAQLGFFGLLINTIFRPSRAFENLANYASRAWIMWGLIVLVVGIMPAISRFQITPPFDNSLPSQENITIDGDPPPEQISAIFFQTTPIISTIIGSLTVIILSWLAWSGSLFLMSRMAGGHGGSFGKLFQMVVWAYIPYTIHDIVQSIYMLITKKTVSLSGLIATKPAGFAPPTPPLTDILFWQRLLTRIEMYNFLHLVLLIVGMIVITNLSKRKASVLVFIGWLLGMFLQVLPSVIFGEFGVGG